MKKHISAICIGILIITLLSGCCINHTWEEATCTAPKTCSKCQKTEGEPLSHTWEEATCTEVKTCSVCGTTEGEPLGHTWKEATCTEAKTCSVCGTIEGEPLGHTDGEWKEVSVATNNSVGIKEQSCDVCGEVISTANVYYYDYSDEELVYYGMALNIFYSVKNANAFGETADMVGAKICSHKGTGTRVTVELSLQDANGKRETYYFWQMTGDKSYISNKYGADFYIEGRSSRTSFQEIDNQRLAYFEKFIYEKDLVSAKNVKVDTSFIY